MRSTSIILLILLVPVLVFAQPDSLWSNTFGGSSSEYCNSVQQTSDGGYMLGGHTYSFGAGNHDFWLVKTDVNGDSLWSHTFGGTSIDRCYSAQQTTDGGYILGGETWSFGAGEADLWLVKTDANGDSLWSCTFGGSDEEYCLSVQQTADGGYILGGKINSEPGNPDFWLVKTDANGDSLWSCTYGGSGAEYCWSVQQTTDGGYILGGFTDSYGAGNSDVWLVKTDGNGDTLWTRTFGGTSIDRCNSVQQTTDGGYILAGYTKSFGAGLEDFWLVKTDANGISLWSHTFGGSNRDECNSVQQTTDGGYILGGDTWSYGAGNTDFWLVKTDANGISLWSRTYGGSNGDYCNSVQQTINGGYILGGDTDSDAPGYYYDFWLVKAGSLCGSLSGILESATHHVACNCSIASGDSLVIMPGATFLFDGHYHFYIEGTLIAEGTVTDSIIFTADTVANPDRWHSLRFHSGSDSSRLTYCRIENGYAYGYGSDDEGGGVMFEGSSPVFSHCTIRNNTANDGGGIGCRNDASPTFTNCIFSGNLAEDRGGGVHCYSNSSPSFTDCIISDNSANYSGGIYCDNSSPILVNCIIMDNTGIYTGGGVYCGYSTAPLISHCTIIGNTSDYGSGVYSRQSSPIITGTIIAFSDGDGIFFSYGSAGSQVEYCDIFGNSGGDILFSSGNPSNGPPGIGVLDTVNANNDSSDIYFNIFLNPMFADTANDDFHLTEFSFCIGAADTTAPPSTDMDGNPRPNPSGSNPDIGAFENELSSPTILSVDSLVISISYGYAVLNWTSTGSSFNIYGGTEPFTVGTLLDTRPTTTWTDYNTATRPSPYFYFVTAVE